KSVLRDIQAVHAAAWAGGEIAQVVAGSAAGVENPKRRLLKLTANDRIGDLPHRHEPPVLFFELIKQLEILCLPATGLPSNESDPACSSRASSNRRFRPGRGPSIP